MWTCPQCGEQHQEQFDACWKCAGRQMPQSMAPDRGPPRTLLGLMPRVLLGCFAGAGLGAAAFGWAGGPLPGSAILGAVVGIAGALFIGAFVWAFFPFAPAKQESEQHMK